MASESSELLKSQLQMVESNLGQTRVELKEMEMRLRALETSQSLDNHKFERIEESLQDKFRALGLRVEELQKGVRGIEVSISMQEDKFDQAISDLQTRLTILATRLQTLGAIVGGGIGLIQLIQFFANAQQ